jgi:hypothetical protein
MTFFGPAGWGRAGTKTKRRNGRGWKLSGQGELKQHGDEISADASGLTIS